MHGPTVAKDTIGVNHQGIRGGVSTGFIIRWVLDDQRVLPPDAPRLLSSLPERPTTHALRLVAR